MTPESQRTWMDNGPEMVVLFGVPFHNVSYEEAINWIVARIHSGKPAMVATANVDFVMQAWKDPELHKILLEADLVLADGAPVVGLSALFGPKLSQRVTGSDLTPLLAKACEKEQFKVFLLGGRPGVAQKSAAVLTQKNPLLEIAGTLSPPMLPLSEMNTQEIVDQVTNAHPDLLLVALGAPKQEKFIRRNLELWRVPVAIGIGGTLDFLAGVQWRAPRLVQKMALEWLWRLSTNPKRLLQRYFQNALFLSGAVFRLLLLRLEALLQNTRPQSPPPTSVDPTGISKTQTVPFPQLSQLNPPPAQGDWALVDLGQRHWLNSRQIATLVSAALSFKKAHGFFAVLCPSPVLRSAFKLCHLERVIQVFPNLETARRVIEDAGSDSGPSHPLKTSFPRTWTAGEPDTEDSFQEISLAANLRER